MAKPKVSSSSWRRKRIDFWARCTHGMYHVRESDEAIRDRYRAVRWIRDRSDMVDVSAEFTAADERYAVAAVRKLHDRHIADMRAVSIYL